MTENGGGPHAAPSSAPGTGGLVFAIAKYSFSGKNNDELSFDKNDVISVTQQLDGGWWEGNLDGKIGWFPSDFVAIIPNPKDESTAHLADAEVSSKLLESNQADNRKEVILEYLKKEREHLLELTRIHDEELRPIALGNILTDEQYHSLVFNLEDVIQCTTQMLGSVANQAKLELSQQRIGNAFLDMAPRLKELLTEYCLNHPNAVSLIDVKRDVLQDFLVANGGSLKDVIGGLSLVFRHVEKYGGLLQEIERNYPEHHADRGNLQRAGAVYRDIFQQCAFLRRQKEMQLEFLAQNYLQRWFGPSYADTLGELVHIGGVTIALGGAEGHILADRKIVLFSKMVVFLESSLPSHEYVLSEKLETQGLSVAKNDAVMSLEFSRDDRKLLTVNSLTSDDFQQLVNAFTSCPAIHLTSAAPAAPNPILENDYESVPMERRAPQGTEVIDGITVDHDLQMVLPDAGDSVDGDQGHHHHPRLPVALPPQPIAPAAGAVAAVSPALGHRRQAYSGHCLRPYPAPRGGIAGEDAVSGRIKLRKGMTVEEQEDAHMLRIVEGYCTLSTGVSGFSRTAPTSSNTPRRAMSQDEVPRPHIIVADQEKMLVEERDGDTVVYKERTLVDTVYNLRDQVSQLQRELELLKHSFEKEQRVRRRLEDSLRRSSQQYSVSSKPEVTEASA